MPKVRIPFTVRDYKALPESETKRYELLGGELVMVPSPTWRHQDISRRLQFKLQEFVEEHNLGHVAYAPLDVVLSDEDVVQPDILYISHERSSIIREDGVYGAPDLIVEILSPTTAERDRTFKKTLYARHGVREYWIVDPALNTVEVFTLKEKGYERVALYNPEDVLRSPLLESLEISLQKIFS
jgi:Uma2 family endonuclease